MTEQISEWSTDGPRGTVHVRLISRDARLQTPGVPAALRDVFGANLRRHRDHLVSVLDGVYRGMVLKPRVSIGKIVFLTFRVEDPGFFYHEYDTRPHWPPFGKGSKLMEWVLAHGMDPSLAFAIAYSMAPETGGKRWLMETPQGFKSVGLAHGKGGHDSIRHPGRKVATQGKYKVTDAFRAELASFDAELNAAIVEALERCGV